MIRIVFVVGSLLVATAASAHQVWIERGPGQTAKVFYGEPADGVIEKAGAGLDKIEPVVFHTDRSRALKSARRDDRIEVQGAGASDLRLVVERFPVWKESDGTHQRAVYYAREGRSEARNALEVELAPLASGGDFFVLTRKGKPVPDAKVVLLAPGGWTKSLKTDTAGQVTLETPWPGRYIAEAVLEDETKSNHQGQEISKTYHVSTICFTEAG